MESDEHKRFYEDNSIGRTFAAKPDIRQKVLTSDAGDGNLLDNKTMIERAKKKINKISSWFGSGKRGPSQLTY